MHAGIDDPYEVPERPEIALNVNDAQGRRQSPEAMARIILTYLEVLTPIIPVAALQRHGSGAGRSYLQMSWHCCQHF